MRTPGRAHPRPTLPGEARRTLSIRWKAAALAGGVALTVVTSVAAGPSAQASTTACGGLCTTPSNKALGTGETPTITVTGSSCTGAPSAGTLVSEYANSACTISVGMATATTTNPYQDWAVIEEGTVDKFISDQALSPALDIQYGADEVVEFEAAPSGAATNLCLALVSSKVTLKQCGLSSDTQTGTSTGTQTDKTTGSNNGSDSESDDEQCCTTSGDIYMTGSLGTSTGSSSSTDTATSTGTSTTSTSIYSLTAWILDSGNTTSGYLDVISGTDQAFSNPQVLMASGTTLSVTWLNELGGVVNSSQMWSFGYQSSSAVQFKKSGMQHT